MLLRTLLGVAIFMVIFAVQRANAQEKLDELESIDSEIVVVQSQLADKQDQLAKAEKNKKSSDEELERMKQQIDQLEGDLKRTADELVSNSGVSRDLEAKIANTRARMLQVLRRAYMEGARSGQESAILFQLIQQASGSNPDSFLQNCFYGNKLRISDTTQLNDYEAAQLRLTSARQEHEVLLEKQTKGKNDIASKLVGIKKKNEEIKRGLEQIRKLKEQQQQDIKSLKAKRVRFETVLASVASGQKLPEDAAANSPVESETSEELSGLSVGTTKSPVDSKIATVFGKVTEPSPFGVIFEGGQSRIVSAIATGKVSRLARLGRFGFLVLISHGEHYFSLYSQLDSVSIKQGDSVLAGTPIGVAGTGGLYLEIRKDGKAIDPARFF